MNESMNVKYAPLHSAFTLIIVMYKRCILANTKNIIKLQRHIILRVRAMVNKISHTVIAILTLLKGSHQTVVLRNIVNYPKSILIFWEML